ncbi:bifunctional molybdenum cofactor biosynthesis protein MoaC/MoaB [Flagellatimonas centrodinii]|uniref:bifunctional molybdenum cofactor biosynthesis protein MoaC/MoaB n=1 Tax=Flagellatimonas centrodinii TaxID=2806210 RepID=UPI001FED3B64|nr:bifunctional molybdenum cofactor biosynthesis protein MoaC/MoaB [Flagellatimonas centrodinii]ULQ47586.1 bifunctional molybdenum cofactor biosynthesis protein MoaC/MoaB [Flagellatimonas centrodinii]
MKDVGDKPETRRSARASCVLQAPADCIERLRRGDTDKGDALKTARVAGILAAKRTDELIPLCHPLPIHRADIDYELGEAEVKVIATVDTIGPTGVEMEALTAASLAALTLYDMLKPHCKPAELRITDTHLEDKRGGKSQFGRQLRVAATAQVIVLSDSVAAGRKPDTAGRAVQAALQQAGFAEVAYGVIADEPDALRRELDAALDAGTALVMTVGGTGVSPRDCTVETVIPYLLQPLPGLLEAARAFGQRRTPYAALSRGVAGYARGNSLIVTCPGSRGGASETLAAILPALVHLIEVCRPGKPHPGGYT